MTAPGALNVGFVGLGTMGSHMAANLVHAGFSVAVHNRTRDKEARHAALGARRAASPAEAADGADVIITMVSDTPDVEGVLFGSRGVCEHAAEGSVVVDMSTISPAAARDFATRLGATGVQFADAPVSGGSEGAEQAALTVMVGAAPETFDVIRPVLQAMGSKITHLGPVGSGQLAKAVNQVIVGGFYLAVAEGIALAAASGLDTDLLLEAIGAGACRSWVLEHRAQNMINGSFPLGFRLALHLKDERIALETAQGLDLDLPLSALVASIEERLTQEGFGDEDVSALARFASRRSGA
jgi:3-hydroxyisobutyrate dehydrogenase-like beta-hydroxyacid dehydrogenase